MALLAWNSPLPHKIARHCGFFLQGKEGVERIADPVNGRALSMASIIHGVVVPQSKKAI